MKKSIFLIAFVPFIFSCTSLQQDVSIEQVSYSEEVLAFESKMASLDATSFEPPLDKNEELHREQALEDFIDEISAFASDPSVQRSELARLLSLKGKAYFLLGKNARAKSFYEEAEKAYKGDAQAAILLSRLSPSNEPADIESKAGEVSEKSLLTLEAALNLYKAKRFSESVAKFDEAFLALPDFYRASYEKIRNMAWNLRSVDADSDVASLLPLKEITVVQMLVLARSKSDFFYNFTGGKKLGDKELFNRAAATGLLNPVSKPLDANNALGQADLVSKYAAARFLWNLYNAKNPNANAKKYSSRMSRSPVLDLPFDSADFDAVLGCIEREFLSLEDGRSFFGNKNLSAVEFDGALEKVQ